MKRHNEISKDGFSAVKVCRYLPVTDRLLPHAFLLKTPAFEATGTNHEQTMLPEKVFDKNRFSNLISHACSVLRLTNKQIEKKFSPHPVCIIYPEKGKEDYSIEIRFDDEQCTITCLFDANRRCDSAFVFLDALCPLTDYVNYFNTRYWYDYIEGRWILPDGYLSMKKSKHDVCFMIGCSCKKFAN
jgi:hypothetical protein